LSRWRAYIAASTEDIVKNRLWQFYEGKALDLRNCGLPKRNAGTAEQTSRDQPLLSFKRAKNIANGTGVPPGKTAIVDDTRSQPARPHC